MVRGLMLVFSLPTAMSGGAVSPCQNLKYRKITNKAERANWNMIEII